MEPTAAHPDRWADLATPGTVPDGFTAWLEKEADKAEEDAGQIRRRAMNALADGSDSCALFDAEAYANGMVHALRLVAIKAMAMQRRAAEAATPKPPTPAEPVTPVEPPAEPVTILGAAVADGYLGVLVQRGADRALLLPNGLRMPVDPDAEPIGGVSPTLVGALLREHDEARNALDGAA